MGACVPSDEHSMVPAPAWCVCVCGHPCAVCVVIHLLLCVVAPLFRDSMSMVVYMSGFLVSGDIPQLQPVVGHLLHFVDLLIGCHRWRSVVS